jgi:hypothetical protein
MLKLTIPQKRQSGYDVFAVNNNMPSPLLRVLNLLLLLILLFFVSALNDLNTANALSDKHLHLEAIAELKRLVPPPSKRELGISCGGVVEGDAMDDDSFYARFLSINNWDPIKTVPSIRQSISWRKRIQPWRLRPKHCPTLCRQHAWIALTSGHGSKSISTDDDEIGRDERGLKETSSKRRSNQPLLPPLDPPYNCPPLQSYRTTAHGLPITYFKCWKWKPHLASDHESELHLAYHIHHLIRRLPKSSPSLRRRNWNYYNDNEVSRICVIFDMRGFETWMLPYIHKSINILRLHYPGRAGAMCFINTPIYFTAVWKVISPWLNDEIRSKVFFVPNSSYGGGGVNDVEAAIRYLNRMKLKTSL